jgi:hypothetical protein
VQIPWLPWWHILISAALGVTKAQLNPSKSTEKKALKMDQTYPLLGREGATSSAAFKNIFHGSREPRLAMPLITPTAPGSGSYPTQGIGSVASPEADNWRLEVRNLHLSSESTGKGENKENGSPKSYYN